MIIPTRAETDLPTFTVLSNGEAISEEIGIHSILVTRSVNRIPTARLVVFDGSVAQQNFEISSGDLFVPGAEIEIKAGYHSDEDTIFKGIVTSQSIKAKNRKPAKLVVEMKDEAVKMTIGRKSRYFEDITDSDLMETLVTDYGLDFEIRKNSPDVTHSEMVQHDVTDWDFLITRAEANGLIVIVDDGKILVVQPDLTDDPVVQLSYGQNILEFEAGMDARDQYAAVKSIGWDMAGQEVAEREADDPGLDEPGNISAADLSEVAGPDEIVLKHTGNIPAEELKAWADAQLLRSRLAKIKGRVKTVGFGSIKPGDVIELAGFGDRFNGSAFVSAISHRVTNEAGWFTETEFGLDKQQFTEIFNDIADQPAGGLIPSVNGLQIGIVTAISDDPDGEERIKVRIPVIDNENEGVWARLATTEAGDTRGFVFRPEVDDEVVVGFLNDDPRDPVILGSLFSSAKPAPVTAEEENNLKGITTRSGIKLIFDDDKSGVTVETPDGNKMVLDDDAGAIQIEDSNGNKFSLSSDGITLESASDISIKATGDVKIEGINVNIKAQAEYKAEGSAGAEMSTSGQAVVKGSVVMIN